MRGRVCVRPGFFAFSAYDGRVCMAWSKYLFLIRHPLPAAAAAEASGSPGGLGCLYRGEQAGRLTLGQANVIRLDQLTVRTILAPINLSYAFAEIPSPAQYTLYVRVDSSDMWASSLTKSQVYRSVCYKQLFRFLLFILLETRRVLNIQPRNHCTSFQK